MSREELIVRVLRQAETIAHYQKQKAGDVHNGRADSSSNRSRPILKYGDKVQLDFRGKCPNGWESVWNEMKLYMDNQPLVFMGYADEAVGIVKWKSECWNVPAHRLFFPNPVSTAAKERCASCKQTANGSTGTDEP